MKISALVLAVSLLSAACARAQVLFPSSFDADGLCEWDDASGICTTADELTQSVEGAYTFCFAPMTMTYTYVVFTVPETLTANLCGQSTCSNGAAGCDATLRVNSAAFDVVAGHASVAAALDDAAFPVQLSLSGGGTENDTLNVSAATATGALDFGVTATCFRDVWEVGAIDNPQLEVAANLVFSGGPLASIANLAVSIWQPYVQQALEERAGAAFYSVLPNPHPGLWACPAP